ncbi:hypothetical protein [Deinococcus kurensis]|uniref:hypothetical protein n=1 Tax=Deinococcus kurensis TaxID=2662757 RepID=UPI0012D2BEF1|nr:hypothetical protein [Deinococcus kurensis]
MKRKRTPNKQSLMMATRLLARLRSGQPLSPDDHRDALDLADFLIVCTGLTRTEQDFLRQWKAYSRQHVAAVGDTARRAISLCAHATRLTVARLGDLTRDPLERMYLAGMAQAAHALEAARDDQTVNSPVQFVVDMHAWVRAVAAQGWRDGGDWDLRGQMTERDRAYLRGYLDALMRLDWVLGVLEREGVDALTEEKVATLVYFMPVVSMRELRGDASRPVWSIKEDLDGWGGMRDVLTVVIPLMRTWTARVGGVERPLKPTVRGDLVEFGLRWVSVPTEAEELTVIARRLDLIAALNGARDARDAKRAEQDRAAALADLRARVPSPALLDVLRLGGEHGGTVPVHRVPQRLRGALRAGEKAGMLRERGAVVELTEAGRAAAQLLAS